jgi:hypothetical protein
MLEWTPSVAGAEKQKPTPAKAAPKAAEDPRLGETRIKLAQRVDLSKGIDPNTPLEDALEFLGERYFVKFTIDTKAFAAVGAPQIKQEPIALPKLVGLKFSRVLQLLLAQLDRNEFAVRYRITPEAVVIVPVKDEDLTKDGEPERDPPDKRLQEKLNQLVNLDKGIDAGTPLKDALEFLADRYDLTLLIDQKAFESIGVPKVEECPVQQQPTVGAKMETVLHTLLRQIRGEVAQTTATFVLEDRHVLIVPEFQAGAISADGKLAATVAEAERRRSIRVCNVASGQEFLRLTKPGMTVASFTFAPDCKRLAVSFFSRNSNENGILCLYDTTSGKELRQWTGRWGGSLLYSADGKTLAFETSEGLTIANSASGTLLSKSTWKEGALRPLGFTPGSRTLITVPRQASSILIVDVATGKGLVRFPIEGPSQEEVPGGAHGAMAEPLEPLAVSPDGKFLVAQGSSLNLSLWEIATGRKVDYFEAAGQMAAFAPDSRLLVTYALAEQKVRLWDVQTGKEHPGWSALKEPITSLAFAVDGKSILAGQAGGPPLRWDIRDIGHMPRQERLTLKELESLWNDLGDDSTVKARSAVQSMAETPEQTLPFLQQSLKPVTADDLRLIPQWITDLDSNRFAVRHDAMDELERLVELAEHDLRRLLAGKPSLEMQQRMENLLEMCKGPVRSPVRLRILRGIEVLEHCQQPAAQQFLKKLSEGKTDALTTREAAAALERVAQRSAYLKTGFSRVQPALSLDTVALPMPREEKPAARPGVDLNFQMPLPRGIEPKKAEALARGLDWLARHQAGDGHWGLHDFDQHGKCNCANAGGSHDVAASAFALLPFLRAGVTHQATDKEQQLAKIVERALKWLITRQGADGAFSGNGYEHALATICICEAYGLTEDPNLKGPAQRAINCCVAWQHTAGGFRYSPRIPGDMSVSGWFVQALHSGAMAGLNVPKATWTGVNNFLDSVGNAEGSGYGYTQPQPAPTMTATGLLCRQMMGWQAKHVGLQKGLEYLRKLPPSPNFKNGYYYYYATQVVHNLAPTNPETWEQWYPKMRDMLIDSQDQGKDADRRHQKGSWSPEGDAWGGQLGRLGHTSFALLTLEVPDQWLPLAQVPAKDLPAKEIDSLWADLAKSNNFKATWSARALASSPQALLFLQDRLRPAPTADTKITDRWIADLDNQRFETRQQAEEELQKLGESAAPALLKVRDSKPGLELAQRVERLLDRLPNLPLSEEQLQAHRAVRVLEHIGTPEARKVLETLAGGANGARLTLTAQAALQRMARQAP